MKNILRLALLSVLYSNASVAGCLDGLTSTGWVHSKIRGIYASVGTTQYVILDKATCSVSGNDMTLADGTKSYYYLTFESTDTFLASTLLAAYAKGDVVGFRILTTTGQYNKIAYAILPAGAQNQ